MQENSGQGNGTLEVFSTFREAWQLTKGAKWAIWAPSLILFAIAMVCGFGIGLYGSGQYLSGAIIALVSAYIFSGVFAGLTKTLFSCIQKRDGLPVIHFYDFSRALPLLVVSLIIMILLALPLIMVVHISYPISYSTVMLSFIYTLSVMTCLYFGPALIVDKTNSPLKAFKMSFQAVRPHLIKVMGIVFVQSLIIELGFCAANFPLLITVLIIIAQIWLYPFVGLVYGVMYQKQIGILGQYLKKISQETLPPKTVAQNALPPVETKSNVIHLLISGMLCILACLSLLPLKHPFQLMSVYVFAFLVTALSFEKNSPKISHVFLVIATVLGCIGIPILVFLVVLGAGLIAGGAHNGEGLLVMVLTVGMILPILLGGSISWGWRCYAQQKYNTALVLTLFPLYCFNALPLLFTGQYM